MNDDPLLWEPDDRHWIRLRGPWDVTWLGPAAGAHPADRRVRLPADWKSLFGPCCGTARFSRQFQRPTNLDANERVLVTLCEVRCHVAAWLNEVPLTPCSTPVGDPANSPCEDHLSFDVTGLLRESNRLVLELSTDDRSLENAPCGLWRPVLLEIIMA